MRLLQRFSLLRRLAIAQERTATALERIAAIAEDTWAAKHAPANVEKSEFSTLDLKYLDERFEKEQEAREAGYELAEDE